MSLVSASVPGTSALAHGGRLAEARTAFPEAPAPFIDLSTGINPFAYPLRPFASASLARLPEPDADLALRAAAAGAYAAPSADYVAAAPGTQILINLLPLLWPRARAAILSPTYAEHAARWSASGSTVLAVPDASALAAQAGPDAVLVLCNPNNPDGRRLDAGRLAAIAGRCAERGALLVVDEAFADLEDDPPHASALLPHPGLVVLRSFGKSYGLAGIRLGFMLADPVRAAAMRDLLGPWAVGGPAIEAGLQALADRAWRAGMSVRLGSDAARLDRLLHRAGLRIVGGTRLFRLAASDGAAAPLFLRLARAGILTRRFETHPGWLRFGLPPDEVAWQRLEAAIRPGGQDT